MLFTKFASSLLTAVLIGASATGELIKVPRGAPPARIARDEATDAIMERCELAAGSAKRSLLPRASVDMGAEDSGPLGTTLDTIGLATCQGVAVSGTYDDDDASGDAVFLAHVGATDLSPLDTLVEKVKAAQDEGLEDIKATISYTDPDSIPEEMAFVADALSGINEKVIDKVNEIDDADITEEAIDWEETASLSIDDSGEIHFFKKTLG